jgi:uncharacterized protein (TIGR03067 family)
MSKYAVLVLATISLFGALRSLSADDQAKEQAVAKELQAFQGTWRLDYKEEDGKKFSADEIKDIFGNIDGSGKVVVRRDGKVIGAGTIKLDPTKSPKAIDVTFTEGKNKGITATGIYEIEGDAFRVCIALGGERPEEFSANSGSGRTLIAYKREKK